MLAGFDLPFDPVKTAGWIVATVVATYAVVTRLLAWWKGRTEQKYGDPGTVKKLSTIDERIHEQLTSLRIHTKACRVVVFQFHNGEQFFSGSPIQKMTATYEAVDGGFASVVETGRQGGMVVSNMSAVLDKMFDDTPLIHEVETMPETYSRTRLQSLNVGYFAVLPLKQYNKIIGCLKIHWMRDVPEGRDWIEDQMKVTLQNIQTLLSERLTISGKHS